MNTDNGSTAPHDLIPPAVADHWKNSIPIHAFLIIDAIRPDGGRGLHAVHDDSSPPWVLIGMLRSILVDMESRWMNEAWEDDDDDGE